ncbi:Zinc finger C2H2 protein [Dictyocoela muelleri]|nr:Zinc finger C2H2 protein [Dictyocoela muelleri]
MFDCVYCNKQFKKGAILRDHLNIHTNNRVYKCETCGASYYFKKHLNVHIKKHGPPAYECCGYKFYLKDKYTRHKKVCGRKFECECGLIYKKEKCYLKHLKEHIIQGEELLEKSINKNVPVVKKRNNFCKLGRGKIQVSFSDQKIPAEYEIVDFSGKKFVKCTKCYKFLQSTNIFRTHYRMQHISDSNYKCKCGQIYKYKKHLDEHLQKCDNF